ncbi:protein Niban 1-like [Megalops cyprinoides]|uniref:protein Niban 1-like n=1 Tax=Megalops cyprinoides TaxID=118141 RepID=UPI0018649894|nr:protein Niban 1-like [Megalops cyprinoides]
MGVSSSSLLDESRSNYIKGRTEAELKNFSPHYRRQYSVAFFSQLQEEVEQHRTGHTQLLKQREAPDDAKILYEGSVLHFDDSKKWKERFVVVRASYSLECHDSNETFLKGAPPRLRLLPAGGSVLMSEEQYMAAVDKAFPDPNGVREDSAQPLVVMPAEFPVYLHLPYHRDAYFCFRQEEPRAHFTSILTDCIRHQNHDALKKATCDVQAFLKAIQSYRQEKGHYESWDMLIGSEVQVLANLVMEELLPSLQTELLPRLKGKKAERKRVWFATVEAAYALVQDQLQEGLAALKEECRASARQQEGLIRSDMDQIISSRAFLEGKLQAAVSEPALKFCVEHVQPYLTSILEELMGPVSAGFQDVRALCEGRMDGLCRDLQENSDPERLRQALEQLQQTRVQDCYHRVDVLREQLHELRNRFKFSNADRLVQTTQIDMQRLMDNAVYTFELLLQTALKDNTKPGTAIEKAKHRVLKQYDYDSSTVRKKIFQEALVDITLPAIKRNLAPSCKLELQKFEQYIFADYTNFIQVENVYEDILLNILSTEVSKVVKEAANLKKHNLFVDSTDLYSVSQASLSDSRTPPRSAPSSPAKVPPIPAQERTPLLQGNGLVESQVQQDTPTAGTDASDTAPQSSKAPSPGDTGTVAADDPAECSLVASRLSDAPPVVAVVTDGAPAAVAPLDGQQATDRAVYLNPATEEQERGIIPPDCPTEGEERGEVCLASPVMVKESGSVQLDCPPEVKGSGTVHIDSPAEVEDSDKVPLDSAMDGKDSSVVHNNSSTAEVKGSGVDFEEDVKEGGIASPCTTHPKIAEEAGPSSLCPDPPVTADSTTSDTANKVEESPVFQGAAESPVGGTTGQRSELSCGGSPSGQDCTTEVTECRGEEPPALDSVREIRDLVVEIIEVEDLVQGSPESDTA